MSLRADPRFMRICYICGKDCRESQPCSGSVACSLTSHQGERKLSEFDLMLYCTRCMRPFLPEAFLFSELSGSIAFEILSATHEQPPQVLQNIVWGHVQDKREFFEDIFDAAPRFRLIQTMYAPFAVENQAEVAPLVGLLGLDGLLGFERYFIGLCGVMVPYFETMHSRRSTLQDDWIKDYGDKENVRVGFFKAMFKVALAQGVFSRALRLVT